MTGTIKPQEFYDWFESFCPGVDFDGQLPAWYQDAAWQVWFGLSELLPRPNVEELGSVNLVTAND